MSADSAERKPLTPAAGKVWGHFTDDRRRSEAEATLLQFQDHAAAILQESGVAPALKAETRFRFLPPAGFLKVGGANFAWKNFLGAHTPPNESPLDEGLVRSVLWHSLGQEPVRVITAANAANVGRGVYLDSYHNFHSRERPNGRGADSQLTKRLIQILDDVLDVLNAHRDPDKAVGNTQCVPRDLRNRGVRHGRRMRDQ